MTILHSTGMYLCMHVYTCMYACIWAYAYAFVSVCVGVKTFNVSLLVARNWLTDLKNKFTLRKVNGNRISAFRGCCSRTMVKIHVWEGISG